MFAFKQAWACLFGALMLAGLIVSDLIWQDAWTLARYDALVVYAVSLQVLFVVFRLETLAEARVILLFHLTGTAMEIFKVNAGSWAYPEEAVLKIAGVPLFSGFMYAAVGSFIARVIRIFDMRFAPYPPFWLTVCLGTAIYINFFSHHFLPDIRIALFIATLASRHTQKVKRLRTGHGQHHVLALLFRVDFLKVAQNGLLGAMQRHRVQQTGKLGVGRIAPRQRQDIGSPVRLARQAPPGALHAGLDRTGAHLQLGTQRSQHTAFDGVNVSGKNHAGPVPFASRKSKALFREDETPMPRAERRT